MRNCSVLLFLLLLPMAADAALLRYELEFHPWSWPHELTEAGVYPSGHGHVIANTELNAIVGGELVCDEFHFLWTNTTSSPLQFLDTYYSGHVVRASGGLGIDALSGTAGYFDLIFYLPANLDNYSAALDQHLYEDVWSDLTFPDNGPPAHQWEYYDLGLMFTVSSPMILNPTPVSEPPVYQLLSLGLAAIVAIRLRRRRSGLAI